MSERLFGGYTLAEVNEYNVWERKIDAFTIRDLISAAEEADKLRAELAEAKFSAEHRKHLLDGANFHREKAEKERDQLRANLARSDGFREELSHKFRGVCDERDELRARLLKFTESPEGKNVLAAMQRDVANREADELDKENARLQAELAEYRKLFDKYDGGAEGLALHISTNEHLRAENAALRADKEKLDGCVVVGFDGTERTVNLQFGFMPLVAIGDRWEARRALEELK